MAFYVDEEEWKCLKHPSKRRRRTGICPTCLRDRLVTLCPECANTRPCSCHTVPADSPSASSSSSSFQFSGGFQPSIATEETSEPAFLKSRSLAIPILRLRSKYDREFVEADKKAQRSKINLWSVFKVSKTTKRDVDDDESNKSDNYRVTEGYSRMMRSRSVAVGAGDSFTPATTKRRGWYLPSPMKAFRQSKTFKSQNTNTSTVGNASGNK